MKPMATILPAALAIGATLCFMIDARLDDAERSERAAKRRIGPLVSEERRAELSVAGVGISRGTNRYLYTRRDGVWRCTWRFALADEAAIGALVEELLSATGPLDTIPEGDEARWGFGGEDEWRIDLLGPDLAMRDDGDVRLSVRLGASLPSVGGGFAQVDGEPGVRTLDVNAAARLMSENDLPPLLDRTLIGRANLAGGVQVTSVLTDFRDLPKVRLVERPSGATEDELRRGASPFVHVLVDDAGEISYTVAGLVGSLFVFLATSEWEEILTPEESPGVGLDAPEGRIKIGRTVGGPIELVVGPTLPDGSCAVLNTGSGLAHMVPPEVARALRMRPYDFLPGTPVNLWDPWLDQGPPDLGRR